MLGRFLQTDPIGYSGGKNLYAYAGNDPVNRTDPDGTCDNPAGCGSPLLAGAPFVLGSVASTNGRLFQAAFNETFGVESNGVKFFTEFANTVPDLYLEGAGLGEIKAGQYVYNTYQIQAQLAAAEAEGIPYYLVVSPTTEVAGTTVAATLETGGGAFVFDSAAGTLTVLEGAEAGAGVAEFVEFLGLLLLL